MFDINDIAKTAFETLLLLEHWLITDSQTNLNIVDFFHG